MLLQNVQITGGIKLRSDITPLWLYDKDWVSLAGIVQAPNGKLIVISSEGTIITSDDNGTTWTTNLKGAVPPVRENFQNINSLNIGGSSNNILTAGISYSKTGVYSTDYGSTWKSLPTDFGADSIVWTGTNWVTTYNFGGEVYGVYSSDLTAWNTSSVPNYYPRPYPYNLASDGKGLVLGLASSNFNEIMKSTDNGASYLFSQSVPYQLGLILYVDGYFFLARTNNNQRQYYYYDTANSSSFAYNPSITMPADVYFKSIASNGTIFVAVFSDGKIGTLNKSDIGTATAWTVRSTGSSETFNSVGYYNSKFIITGSSGILMSSTDGINWTIMKNVAQLSALGTISTAVQNGNNLLLFGYKSNSARVFVSTDNSVTYTEGTISISESPADSTTDGTYYYCITGNARIIRSTDGLSWSTVRNPSGTSQSICYGEAITTYKYLASNNETDSFTSLLGSTDGLSWSAVSAVGYRINRIRYYSNKFIILGETSSGNQRYVKISTSTDGSNYTLYDGPSNVANGFDIAYSGSVYVIVSTGGKVYTSSNLSSWTSVQVGSSTIFLVSVIWDGSKFILTGPSGSIYTSTNGSIWTNVSCDQAMVNSYVYTRLGAISDKFIIGYYGLVKYNTFMD